MSISIIMANYNYGCYLRFALDGIVNQTRRPDEFILVDDASTDHSMEIIAEYVEKYPWITVLQNVTNLGAYQSIQKGINVSRGDYIYFAASDDRLGSRFIEESVRGLNQYPQAGLVCSSMVFFQDNEEITSDLVSKTPLPKPRYLSPQDFMALKRKRFGVAGNTIVFRRTDLNLAGGILEPLGSLCDWFVGVVIGLRKGMVFLPARLAFLRRHTRNLSGSHQNSKPYFVAMFEQLNHPKYEDIKKIFYSYAILNENRPGVLYALNHLKIKQPVVVLLWIREVLAKCLAKLPNFESRIKKCIGGYMNKRFCAKIGYRESCGRRLNRPD